MNLFEFFDEYDIEHNEEGENVTAGWTNIQCLFCDDEKNHLGIRLSDFHASCWRCGGHRLTSVISSIADCNYKEALKIEKEIKAEPLAAEWTPPIYGETSSARKPNVHLPQESTIHFPKIHLDYLKKRGFRPRNLIRKYKLRAVYTIGKYKFRIIIPIFLNRKLVSFTSRDITDEQELRYRAASTSESAINPKMTLYNYDTLTTGTDAILVEGPTDVWKLGDGAISLMGLEHTEEQLILLMKKKINNLFILFDTDKKSKQSQIAARKLARIMSPLVKNVEVVRLEKEGDPGGLSLAEAAILKRILLNS